MSDGSFARRVTIVGAVAVVAALAVLYMRLLANTFLVLFAGLLFAVLLQGCAKLVRRGLAVPKRAAVLATLLVGFLSLVVLGWWIGPRAADQMMGLPERVASAAENLRASLASTDWGRTAVDRVSSGLQSSASGILGGVMGAFSTVVGAATKILIILFLGLFLAWNPTAYSEPVVRLAPPPTRSRVREVLDAMEDALQSWLAGRLLSMAVVGLLTMTGLFIAGVPLALALGIIAGLLSFVPFVGPLVAAVPAVLVGFGEGPTTALVVALIYGVVQALESYMITPLIEQRVVSLPPAFVLTAQTVMGLLFGVVGVLVATPVALVLVVLVQMIYLEDVLGESVHPAGT